MPAPHVMLHVPAHEMVQAPSQVMLHVPAPQATFDPAPTTTVHVVPLHATSVAGPPDPLHIESASHVRWAPEALLPKSQV